MCIQLKRAALAALVTVLPYVATAQQLLPQPVLNRIKAGSESFDRAVRSNVQPNVARAMLVSLVTPLDAETVAALCAKHGLQLRALHLVVGLHQSSLPIPQGASPKQAATAARQELAGGMMLFQAMPGVPKDQDLERARFIDASAQERPQFDGFEVEGTLLAAQALRAAEAVVRVIEILPTTQRPFAIPSQR